MTYRAYDACKHRHSTPHHRYTHMALRAALSVSLATYRAAARHGGLSVGDNASHALLFAYARKYLAAARSINEHNITYIGAAWLASISVTTAASVTKNDVASSGMTLQPPARLSNIRRALHFTRGEINIIRATAYAACCHFNTAVHALCCRAPLHHTASPGAARAAHILFSRMPLAGITTAHRCLFCHGFLFLLRSPACASHAAICLYNVARMAITRRRRQIRRGMAKTCLRTCCRCLSPSSPALPDARLPAFSHFFAPGCRLLLPPHALPRTTAYHAVLRINSYLLPASTLHKLAYRRAAAARSDKPRRRA